MCFYILFLISFAVKSGQTGINTGLESRCLIDMKEWLCVQVVHHKRISKAIRDHQEKGWVLHTYEATGMGDTIHHYLLFEKTSTTN